jgi:alpha-tubulin suppressor-like RCC1 family protein
MSTITNDILKTFKINSKNFKKTSCGYYHSLILIEGENVKTNLFGFGRNEEGQLGLGIKDKTISKPYQINFFDDKNILDFECCYSSHILLSFVKK